MNKKFIKINIVSICALFTLSGCFISVPYTDREDKIVSNLLAPNGVFFIGKNAKAKMLAEEEFKIKLVKFADKRIPENHIALPEDNIIYEYSPDKLVQGIKARMPGMLKRYFTYGVRNQTAEKTYFAEVDVKYIRTYIETGGLLSTRFGNYVTRIEADILFRNNTSAVVWNDTVLVEYNTLRSAVDGRHPSVALDRKKMMATFTDAVKRLAIKAGWALRKAHHDKYDKKHKQVIED